MITHGIVHGSAPAMGTENVLSSSSSFTLCHADSTSTFKTGLLESSFLSQLIIVFIPTLRGRWMGGRLDACVSEGLVLLLLSCAVCGWCVSETDPRWLVGACVTVRACLLFWLLPFVAAAYLRLTCEAEIDGMVVGGGVGGGGD